MQKERRLRNSVRSGGLSGNLRLRYQAVGSTFMAPDQRQNALAPEQHLRTPVADPGAGLTS